MKKPKAVVANWKAGGQGHRSLTPAPTRSVPHLPITPQRRATYLKHLGEFGSHTKAALMTDGNPNTRRAYRALEIRDPSFGKAVEDALAVYSERIAGVIREEFFIGRTEYVVSGGELMLDPETKKPLTKRIRDSRLLLAVARKHDEGLRDLKSVHVDITGNVSDPSRPSFQIFSQDIWLLEPHEADSFLAICRKIHAARSEPLPELAARPDYIDGELAEVVPLEEMTVEQVTEAFDI